MRIAIILLFGMSTFISCSSGSNNSTKIIPKEKMELILFDLLRSDELVNNFLLKDTLLKRDSVAMQMYEQVFRIHKTDRKTFFNSYKYYQVHPDQNKELFDSLTAFGNRKRIATTVK